MSIRYLASALIETNQLFISSRAIVRSRANSLYANEDTVGIIHPVSISTVTRKKLENSLIMRKVFDYFTATLGLPSEIPIKETPGSGMSFPGLDKKLCSGAGRKSQIDLKVD